MKYKAITREGTINQYPLITRNLPYKEKPHNSVIYR